MALKYPQMLDWEITPFCNHNCIHCYNCWRTQSEIKKDIDFHKNVTSEYYEKIADKIIEAKPVSIIITGGEPLSQFSKVKKAIIKLLDAGIFVSINSNATLINDEMVEFLKEYDIPMFISLPSSNKEHCESVIDAQTSDLIYKNIKRLTNEGLDIAVNMVVSKINYNDIEDTIRFAANELGVKSISVTKASLPINANPKMKDLIISNDEFINIFKILLRLKDELNIHVDSAWAYGLCAFKNNEDIIKHFGFKRSCSAGKYSFCIGANGDVKACAVDDNIYGNVFNDTFETMIAKMTSWQEDDYIPNECKNCNNLDICGAGCRLDAKNTNGSINALDSTMDMDYKDINYLEYIEDVPNYDMDKVFNIHDNLVFVEDNDCIRMSIRHMGSALYITKELQDFLQDKKSFSVKEFKDTFEFDDDTLMQFLVQLKTEFFIY